MNLRDEYEKIEDYLKTDYFARLSPNDRKDLFKELTKEEQNDILENLPFQYLKSFISTYTEQEQRELYRRLNEDQLKAIYTTMNKDEKQQMATVLDEVQNDLLKRIEEKRENINQASNKMIASTNQIKNSTINLANAKINLKTQNQELKQMQVVLKKLDKERERKLKKVLKASKPSIFDRISIISKYRTKKLLNKVEQLEMTNQQLDEMRTNKDQIIQNIKNTEEYIQKEKENIEKSKDRIAESKKEIHLSSKQMKDLTIQVKKVSKTEKRILGRKLYRQQVNMRESIMIRRKPTQTNQQNKENSHPNSTSDTKTAINNFIQTIAAQQQAGIEYANSPLQIDKIQAENLQEDPLSKIDQNQEIVFENICQMISEYQNAKKTHKTNEQDINNQYTRVKRSSGIVSLSLLLSIILFIFSLFLFFIK